MEKSKIKNMVILKNLPSNLIEEAFVFVKDNSTERTFEYIDNERIRNAKENERDPKEYILKEAENVLNNYISIFEKENENKIKAKKEKEYKMLKIYSLIITLILIISLCL